MVKAPASLTAQTAMEILRNSNLDEFNFLVALMSFTIGDQVNSQITKKKKFGILVTVGFKMIGKNLKQNFPNLHNFLIPSFDYFRRN